MTIKEYNKLRSAVYAAALELPEVEEAIRIVGIAYIAEVQESTGNHGVIVLTARMQLNDNTLRESGFDPEKSEVKIKMVLHRRTKCADIL